MLRLLTIIALSFATATPCSALSLPGPILGQVNVPRTDGQAPTAPANPSATQPPADGSAEDQQGQGARQDPSPLPTLIMFGAIFLIFWLFIIRPQSKKQKEHTEMVSALQRGDDVITQSGILGRITGFDDEHNAVLIEVAKDTRIRVLRSQVGSHQKKQESNS